MSDLCPVAVSQDFIEDEYQVQYKFIVKYIAGALDLLQLSQKYKVHPLAKKCEELLQTQIQVEDSVKVFETARRYGRQDLMNRAGEIMVKSFLNLIETDALANAEEETLVYLLERDDLNIEEVKLFQLIMNWGKIKVKETGNEQSLKDKLKNLISKIRYTNMTPFEFTKLVVPTGLLSAEECLSVYSYFGGDEATRAALKIKFNTTRRIVGKVEKFVDFFAKNQVKLDWAPAFWEQTLNFKVEWQPQGQAVTKEWSVCVKKTTVISRIRFQWPKIQAKCKLAATLDVSIFIMETSGRNNPNRVPTLKFKKVLVGCKPGISEDVDVKPPVELIPGSQYALTFANDSSPISGENLQTEPGLYYGHVFPTSESIANRDLLFENGSLGLRETHMATTYYSAISCKSPFTFISIKGITVELA